MPVHAHTDLDLVEDLFLLRHDDGNRPVHTGCRHRAEMHAGHALAGCERLERAEELGGEGWCAPACRTEHQLASSDRVGTEDSTNNFALVTDGVYFFEQ